MHVGPVLGARVADGHRTHLVAEGGGRREGLRGQPGQGRDGNDHQGAFAVWGFRNAAEAEPLADPCVGAVHGLEGDHEQRQGDHDQPGALLEFLHGDDDGGETGEQCAEAVEQRFAAPSPSPLHSPVPDHAHLRDGEADEDADREERHEGVGVAAGEDEQRARDNGQSEDAVPVDLPVRLQGEHVRRVVVAGQQLEQDRQAAEGGVRRQGEQDHGGELDDVEGPVVAERGVRELGEDCDALDRLEVEAADQHRQTDEHHAEDDPEADLRALGPPDARDPEGGNGVGDGLDPSQSGTAGGEGFQQEQCPHGVGVVRDDRGVPGRGHRAQRFGAEQTDGYEDEDRADEDDCRRDERLGGLHDPAQVDPRDQSEHRQAEPQPVVVERREGGGQRRHSGRDRHGDVQDVVQDQRGRGHQTRPRTQVGLRDRVGAAAVREGRDHLPVRRHQHRQQGGDGQCHRHGESQAVGARRSQDEDDRLGPVRHRRHRVQRQRGEPGDGGQPVAFTGIRGLLAGGDGIRLGGQDRHGCELLLPRPRTRADVCAVAPGSVRFPSPLEVPCGIFAPNQPTLTPS